MEDSSPLATMHRPVPPPWGSNDLFRSNDMFRSNDLFRSHAHSHLSAMTSGASSLSLRERLHKPNPDYFNVKDVRGSSPAASLAADLSQNFRLDADVSPPFPTPRRALFTSNMSMFGAADDSRHYVTTPPLPSSSPGQLNEFMDISPLPHKAPFCSQIEVTSPTPLSTPTGNDTDDEMMLDSPAPITRQALLEPPKPMGMGMGLGQERRKAAPRRPSLTRMKGFSTCGVPGRTNTMTDNQLPTFRFGAGESRLNHMSSALSLGECFESASPPQERRPQTANSPTAAAPGALRSRGQFGGMSAMGGRNGGCGSGHSRRPSNPFMRPRKQFRRSLSMFEHPGDIMKPKTEDSSSVATTELQSVSDVEDVPEPVLPHYSADDPSDTIPRISKQTMVDVLDGKYSEQYNQKMIIDCRFEYEYDGGHIDGAVNYNSKDLLASHLFKTPMQGRSLLIFHCEYSAHRAPLMARHVRSEDRLANVEHYPRLTYPDVYILEGGYSGFFDSHRARCYPPNYVEMSDENHQRTCERELGRLKNKNSRKGLGRAQTFAFGQRESCVDQSPTAPPISRPSLTIRQDPIAMIGNSPILGERSYAHSRRMASY